MVSSLDLFLWVCAHILLLTRSVFFLANDLAGEKVFPAPVVTDNPVMSDPNDSTSVVPVVYPACVVTRAQSQRAKTVNLSETFFVNLPETTEPE